MLEVSQPEQCSLAELFESTYNTHVGLLQWLGVQVYQRTVYDWWRGIKGVQWNRVPDDKSRKSGALWNDIKHRTWQTTRCQWKPADSRPVYTDPTYYSVKACLHWPSSSLKTRVHWPPRWGTWAAEQRSGSFPDSSRPPCCTLSRHRARGTTPAA